MFIKTQGNGLINLEFCKTISRSDFECIKSDMLTVDIYADDYFLGEYDKKDTSIVIDGIYEAIKRGERVYKMPTLEEVKEYAK